MSNRLRVFKLDYGDLNTYPLNGLLTILKKLSQNMTVIPEIIPEIYFLKQFSGKLCPITICNPANVIKFMMTRHGHYMDKIYENPTGLKTFIYHYNLDENVEKYVFSNNMMFYVDIITICYVFYIVNVCKNLHPIDVQLAHQLMSIMEEKYCTVTAEQDNDLNNISLKKIIFSYPSIFLSIMHYNSENLNIFDSFYTTFSNISCIFRPSWISSIIPVLNSDIKIPLALLVAVLVKTSTNIKKASYVLFQRTLTSFTSEVFPEDLKLQLCKDWGIVYMIEGEYKYAPYFKECAINVKRLIVSLRSNDPSVLYAIFNINFHTNR